MEIIHIKQKHAPTDKGVFVPWEKAGKYREEIVESQFKIYHYLNINNPGGKLYPVVLEGYDEDLVKSSPMLSQDSGCPQIMYIFEEGVPAKMDQLSFHQVLMFYYHGAVNILICQDKLPKAYKSFDQDALPALNGLTDLFYNQNKFAEVIIEKYRGNYQEALADIRKNNGKEFFAKVAGDKLFIDREIAAVNHAKIAEYDFYGNYNEINKVLVIFGESHSFSQACEELNCFLNTISLVGDASEIYGFKAVEEIFVPSALIDTSLWERFARTILDN